MRHDQAAHYRSQPVWRHASGLGRKCQLPIKSIRMAASIILSATIFKIIKSNSSWCWKPDCPTGWWVSHPQRPSALHWEQINDIVDTWRQQHPGWFNDGWFLSRQIMCIIYGLVCCWQSEHKRLLFLLTSWKKSISIFQSQRGATLQTPGLSPPSPPRFMSRTSDPELIFSRKRKKTCLFALWSQNDITANKMKHTEPIHCCICHQSHITGPLLCLNVSYSKCEYSFIVLFTHKPGFKRFFFFLRHAGCNQIKQRAKS